MSKKINCWCCNGNGWIDNEYDDMYGNSNSFYEECDYCEGKGELDEKEEKIRNQRASKFAREFVKNNQ